MGATNPGFQAIVWDLIKIHGVWGKQLGLIKTSPAN